MQGRRDDENVGAREQIRVKELDKRDKIGYNEHTSP